MKQSILIVDDDPFFCTSLKSLLQEEGYEITSAYSGKEGLFYLECHTFDAVVIDIGLPDLYGIDIAAETVKRFPDTAVIILTGKACLDNAVAAFQQGVYDFLRKPCTPDAILRTLARGIQHKRLQKELKETKDQFQQLSECTWEGIAIYDDKGLLLINNQFCEMFEYSEHELLALHNFNLLLEKNCIQVLQPDSEAIASQPFKALGIKRDGRRFPVEIRIKHINYQGRPVKVATLRDVTDQERTMQQHLLLQEKLAEAKRMEALGLMAGSVAHDLNNILAGIITYPELLLLDLDETFQYREEIRMIRDAGKRAAALVDDLLTVARGATSKKIVQNMNPIVSTYFNSMEHMEMCKRFPYITCDYILDTHLHNSSCSSMHVSKSIMNLVINAAEAIQHTGIIMVSTQNIQVKAAIQGYYETIEPGQYVVISVSDNGPGISDTDIKKIFSPFYSTKVLGRSGTGLGLAVVWNTMRDHNGYINVESSTNGTTFFLYFPAEKSPSQDIQLTPLPETIRGNGERILIVDDQKNQREIALRLLNRLGYTPFAVSSGEDALEFLKKNSVELVLLDMLMDPGMNGYETFRMIQEYIPNQKAVITSGYAPTKDVQRAKRLGISQFVKKPFTLQELGLVIQNELNV
ncbi:hybrid sensor histidine kinase/response regulator [Desulfogranum japonicum]|uniref:hybrid sensor histidine kinase/response regulator n=1 Tax=Desulfogranum japonicum TaxID=231447 RepID=UPI00048A5F92|nr:response regulator [Desulfogranum japonicum]